jgi:hypothetical protein
MTLHKALKIYRDIITMYVELKRAYFAKETSLAEEESTHLKIKEHRVEITSKRAKKEIKLYNEIIVHDDEKK